MNILEILLVAVGLAMDAFAVCVAASCSGRVNGSRATFRLSFHFGFFQFMMPLVGWSVGSTVAPLIEQVDHWIAMGLLAFVGTRMVISGIKGESKPECDFRDPSRGWTLVALSVATSIDALAVGFSLAMLQVDIWCPAITIGVVTAVLSVIGVYLGRRLGATLGRWTEVAGGLLLIFIGMHILFSHL